MRDRYFTKLTPGMQVADLRSGRDARGKVLGPAGDGRIRVEWDGGEDEDVFEGDIVAAGTMHVRRRRS